MSNYKKPHLKLGEVLMLLAEEDYELIEVLGSDSKVEFQGDLGEIRRTNVEHYTQLKERYVQEVNFNDYSEYVIWLEEN